MAFEGTFDQWASELYETLMIQASWVGFGLDFALGFGQVLTPGLLHGLTRSATSTTDLPAKEILQDTNSTRTAIL